MNTIIIEKNQVKMIVIHDARTNRVSAVDKVVEESNLEELQGVGI